MKNKKLLYVLLPAVVSIWGFVGYRLVNFSSDDEVIEPIRVKKVITDRETTKKQPLALDYADPFLKNVSAKRRRPSSAVVHSKPTLTPKNAPSVNWEHIVYKGYIQNGTKASRVGLVEINEKKRLAAINDQLYDIKVLDIRRDSIKLQKAKEVRWFKVSRF